MSTGFAIAAATAALADRLHALIGDAVPGARVTTLNPGAPALRGGEPIVNLYLFRTLRNGFVSNRDLPTRDAAGRPRASPTLMLDLDYMITFFGDENRLDPQRLLGLVAGGLNAEPSIPRGSIRATIAATPWLAGADLDAQAEALRVTPMSLPPDAMARLWSEFVNVPYQLTQLYTVTPVALTVPLDIAPALPLRRIGLDASGAGPIRIGGIVNADDPDRPLAGGERMAIRIADPSQANLTVRLDGRPAAGVSAGVDSAGRPALLLTLDAGQPGLQGAGAVTVQVVRTKPDAAGDAARSVPHRVLINPGLGAAPTYDPADGSLSIPMALPVPAEAAAALLLYPVRGTAGPARRISIPGRSGPATTLVVPATSLAAGVYLVSIEIDGMRSLLAADASGYTGPHVRTGDPAP